MYVGTAKILTKSVSKQVLPAIIMLVFGYFWFYYGLLVLQDIEYTMYVFLYTLWTPLCATIAYCFYLYGVQLKFIAPKIIAAGFALLGITYLAWAPWHTSAPEVYFIWFFLFDISLPIILMGYVILPYEIKIKTPKGESSSR